MSAPRIRELQNMAAKLSAIARKLPPGRDRDDAYQEIAKYRDKIGALARSERNKPILSEGLPKAEIGFAVQPSRHGGLTDPR